MTKYVPLKVRDIRVGKEVYYKRRLYRISDVSSPTMVKVIDKRSSEEFYVSVISLKKKVWR